MYVGLCFNGLVTRNRLPSAGSQTGFPLELRPSVRQAGLLFFLRAPPLGSQLCARCAPIGGFAFIDLFWALSWLPAPVPGAGRFAPGYGTGTGFPLCGHGHWAALAGGRGWGWGAVVPFPWIGRTLSPLGCWGTDPWLRSVWESPALFCPPWPVAGDLQKWSPCTFALPPAPAPILTPRNTPTGKSLLGELGSGQLCSLGTSRCLNVHVLLPLDRRSLALWEPPTWLGAHPRTWTRFLKVFQLNPKWLLSVLEEKTVFPRSSSCLQKEVAVFQGEKNPTFNIL